MVLRRCTLLGACLFSAVFLVCGVAVAATTYPDRVGDVEGGPGPDLASITVSNTKTMVTFRVRFAKAPPLRISTAKGWADMLLIGIDVPPIGPPPAKGGWLGVDFALGTHGPSKTGRMVKLGHDVPQVSPRARFKIVTSGSTLTFSIPRRALGNPAWFRFNVAAGREMPNGASGGGGDGAPAANRTFRYTLTG